MTSNFNTTVLNLNSSCFSVNKSSTQAGPSSRTAERTTP